MIITIDGPAGTGKTTIAKQVAKRLNFLYFDTGASYRSITWYFLENHVNYSDLSELKKWLKSFNLQILSNDTEKTYSVGMHDVTEEIRSLKVTEHVSTIAALREVRELVWDMQRNAGKNCDAVFEGRDMGTVVFPHAELKIFLTASPEVRAKRRFAELKDEVKNGVSEKELLKTLLRRDELDSTRELGPLKKAEDAHLIDTSNLSIDQVVAKILEIKRAKFA